jgi:hypothetical protein
MHQVRIDLVVPCYLRRSKSPPLSTFLERYTQFKKLHEHITKITEERLVITSVLLNQRSHLLVLNESQIRRKHHQRLTRAALKLLRPIPSPDFPCVARKHVIVFIADIGWGVGPGTVES